MTQEEKELLLRDLGARIYYKVKVQYKGTVKEIQYIEPEFGELCFTYPDNSFTVPVADCKPYLRPLSSMTEEEKDEIALIRDRDFQSIRKWVRNESIKETGNIYPITCGEIDFCNKKHLDYRGLIPMGLALEAPEGMYNK